MLGSGTISITKKKNMRDSRNGVHAVYGADYLGPRSCINIQRLSRMI